MIHGPSLFFKDSNILKDFYNFRWFWKEMVRKGAGEKMGGGGGVDEETII